jgi:DNA-binding response OmpR family regulator
MTTLIGAREAERPVTQVVCDLKRCSVRCGDKSCIPTVDEWRLCLLLSAQPGHVKSRAQILDVLYPTNFKIDERTIDSHVKRLRAKFLATLGVDPIQTRYGFGYSWNDQP